MEKVHWLYSSDQARVLGRILRVFQLFEFISHDNQIWWTLLQQRWQLLQLPQSQDLYWRWSHPHRPLQEAYRQAPRSAPVLRSSKSHHNKYWILCTVGFPLAPHLWFWRNVWRKINWIEEEFFDAKKLQLKSCWNLSGSNYSERRILALQKKNRNIDPRNANRVKFPFDFHLVLPAAGPVLKRHHRTMITDNPEIAEPFPDLPMSQTGS